MAVRIMQGLGPLGPTVGLLLGGAVPQVDSPSGMLTFTCIIGGLDKSRNLTDIDFVN